MDWLHAEGALEGVLQVRDGVLGALALAVALAVVVTLAQAAGA